MFQNFILFLIISALIPFQNLALSQNTRSPANKKFKWNYQSKGKIYAIGDIHADPHAFLDILVELKILNQEGEMIAKNFDLVINGDLIGKGPDSRGVWDIVLYLKKLAKSKNSRIHTLLGNHEIILASGNTQTLSKDDLKKFKDFDPKSNNGFFKAFTSKPYKKIMRNSKAIIKIDDNIFVHGGIEKWIYNDSPKDINIFFHEYIVNQQDIISEKLKSNTRIKPSIKSLVKNWKSFTNTSIYESPLWSNKVARKKMPKQKLVELLEYLNVKRIFLGHTPTKNHLIEVLYQKSVYLIDTNISRFKKDGKLSAMVITKKSKVIIKNNLERGTSKNLYNQIKRDIGHCGGIIKAIANTIK